MKLIIAGSRNINEELAYLKIEQFFNETSGKIEKVTEVVSGTAMGADRAGEFWANKYSVKVSKFPADWNRYGKSAGYRRNLEMAEYADQLLLVWDGQSKGSGHMKNIMTKLKKPVHIILLNSLLDKKQDKDISYFIDYVELFCIKNKIEFKIFDGTVAYTINTGDPCKGFFEANSKIKPTLGIASKLDNSLFYEILIHEFCHANQYIENSPYWINSRLTKEEIENNSHIKLEGSEAGDLFTAWLDKKVELPENYVYNLALRTAEVEFDCEQRVINLIKKFNLNINVEDYSQRANAYVAAHFRSIENREWQSDSYTNPEFYSEYPKTLDISFCKTHKIKQK